MTSPWWWLAVAALLIFIGWTMSYTRKVAVDLASRPKQQYDVAGLDKGYETGRHALWGTGPIRMRRLRRRLDAAAADIERFEQEQRRRRP